MISVVNNELNWRRFIAVGLQPAITVQAFSVWVLQGQINGNQLRMIEKLALLRSTRNVDNDKWIGSRAVRYSSLLNRYLSTLSPTASRSKISPCSVRDVERPRRSLYLVCGALSTSKTLGRWREGVGRGQRWGWVERWWWLAGSTRVVNEACCCCCSCCCCCCELTITK